MPGIRAFIAIELDEELKKNLARAQDILSASVPGRALVSWTRPESMHLTLRFLGDIDEGLVNLIKIAMLDAAGNTPYFEAAVEGIGAFPGFKEPRVIWAGLKNGDKVKELYSRIEAGLEKAGLEKETRPLHPHLTLGRIKERIKGHALAEAAKRFHGGGGFGAIKATEIVLFKSELRRGGAVHTPLARAALKKGG